MNTFKVDKYKYIIVSPGGFPNDIDLYISQRALELTRNAAEQGGQILFLSECSNMVGSKKAVENFYHFLTKPLEQIYPAIEKNYFLYAHKPYKFAQLIQHLDKLWVHSKIPSEMIERAHMSAASNPQKVVQNWVREDPGARILVVDGANKLALI